MTLPTIKELVTDTRARLKHFKGQEINGHQYGELWYVVYKEAWHGDNTFTRTEMFTFPVPIVEAGFATFEADDRAIIFMRYIRKHLDLLTRAHEEADETQR